MRMKKLRGGEGERGRGGENGKGKRTQDIGMGIRDCHDLKKPGLAMTTICSFSLEWKKSERE
jgi:hypothetical protein